MKWATYPTWMSADLSRGFSYLKLSLAPCGRVVMILGAAPSHAVFDDASTQVLTGRFREQIGGGYPYVPYPLKINKIFFVTNVLKLTFVP